MQRVQKYLKDGRYLQQQEMRWVGRDTLGRPSPDLHRDTASDRDSASAASASLAGDARSTGAVHPEAAGTGHMAVVAVGTARPMYYRNVQHVLVRALASFPISAFPVDAAAPATQIPSGLCVSSCKSGRPRL